MRLLGWASILILLECTGAQAVLVTYDTAGDLASNFALNSGPAGLRFAEAPSGGLGGSRAVDIINALDADNTTAVYRQGSFDLSGPGQTVTVSEFALRRNGQLTNTPFMQLGILGDTNLRMDNDLAANSYASMIMFPNSTNAANDVNVQFERRVSGGARTRSDAGIVATLTTGHWYLFSATFTYDTSTSLLFGGSLQDWGTTGAAFSSTVFTVPNTSIALSGTNQVNGDTTVWPGYRGYLEGGADLYDNFSAVPEPASFTFLCCFGWLAIRRRSSRR